MQKLSENQRVARGSEMNESDDPNILPLKQPEADGFFRIKERDWLGENCRHRRFVVDIQEREVLCQHCDKVLDPMQVLISVAQREVDQIGFASRMDDVEKRYYHREIKRLLARKNMPPFRVEQTRQWLREMHAYTSVELARKARELEGVLRQLNTARRRTRREAQG